MTKILITGASGFVGTHLLEAVSKLGWEIHAAVRKSSNIDNIKSFVSQFIYLDQSDFAAVKDCFETTSYDYVIHAAALTKAKTEQELLAANVRNTENLIRAAFTSSNPPKRFVFVSSLAAIGPIAYDAPSSITEDTVYAPVTAYGRSKRDAEQMIKEHFAAWPISVFRPTAVYGPREKDLFILFDTLNKGIEPYIGRAPQKLSFVYVKDLVQVLILGCTVAQENLQFYNISDGKVYNRFAMADIFKALFAKKTFRFYVPFAVVSWVAKLSAFLYRNSTKTPTIYPERLGELTAQNWSCSIEKANNKLGYVPDYDLKKGLTEALLWYKKHNWLK